MLSGCAGLSQNGASPEEKIQAIEIQATMADWRKATMSGDVDGFSAILAEDYSYNGCNARLKVDS